MTESTCARASSPGQRSWWERVADWEVQSRFAVHPVLIGCLFVVQGCATLEPMVRFAELAFWLAAVSATILLLQTALAFFVPHPRKPALLASLCLVFFCYLDVGRTEVWKLTSGTRFLWFSRTAYMLPAATLVFLAVCRWILRTPRTLLAIRRYLDVVVTLLLAMTLPRLVGMPPSPEVKQGQLATTPMPLGSHPPDIYFILTDANTGPESLKTYWGYDESPFVNYFTDTGFHVIKNAHGNATFTPVCLSTYLNMDHPQAPSSKWPMLARVAYYCQIISGSEAPSRLEASGYDVRTYSIFDVGKHPHFYTFTGITRPTLGNVLWDRTILGSLKTHLERISTGDVNLKLFSLLPQIAAEKSDKPKFVYAHILMPHFPYLFDKEGHRIERGLRPEDDHPEEYLGQLIYENTLITNAVAGILKNSKSPPIIIIQGDHGYRDFPGPHRKDEATTIFNALYLPGSTPDWLYPGITPVNTFRLIFNHYFDQHYSYLPDTVPSFINPVVAGPAQE